MLKQVGANMAPSVRSTNTIVRTSTTAIAENDEVCRNTPDGYHTQEHIMHACIRARRVH